MIKTRAPLSIPGQSCAPPTSVNSMAKKGIGKESAKNHMPVVMDPTASFDMTTEISTDSIVIFYGGKSANVAKTNANVTMTGQHLTKGGMVKPST